MIAAIVVLFVGSLLLTATYLSANGDIKLTRTSLNSKKAYYAAMAGIANFQYHLNNNSRYEMECPVVKEAKVPQNTAEKASEPTVETYSYQVVPASESAYTECTKGISLSMIESNKRATGTFRVISTGTAGTKGKSGYQTRSVVATFTHEGFTHWVYYTNYEDLDPSFYEPKENCARHEYETIEGKKSERSSECLQIEFVTGDSLNGPVHTNDAADICGKPVFGREGHEDKIEINGGTYSSCSSDSPEYKGKYTTEGKEITPPATDAELANAASSEYHFYGKTLITLNANTAKPEEANTITVTNNNETKTLPWPVSGVLYVSNSSSGGCKYIYSPYDSIYTTDEGCGNAYVHGTYTKSLTIGSENNIVINGNIQTQTNTEGKPEGNAVLGLIATNYIRVYHPVAQTYEPSHVTPETQSAINGKCVTEKEVSARIHKSTEVTEVTTTGLAAGDEVGGTGISAGTTISKVESGNKIILSKAATVSAKELNATIAKSTEVTGITTSSLAVGDEVEGTVSGQIESGTVITEVKASSIKLNKAAKPSSSISVTGTTTKSSSEVTSITPTTGLAVGDEVEGSGIPSGTTITEIKASEKKIKLSKSATSSVTKDALKVYPTSESTKLKFYGETIKLKVYVPTGYEYNSVLKMCHKVESGYSEYVESENLYVGTCKSGTKSTGTGKCEYENGENSRGEEVCDAPNLSASEDTNKWGSLENPIIDAAILTTAHSFIVDNYKCGEQLGSLTIWGSIAQDFRGTVGTNGSGGTGYLKNYNYDERLATVEPPDFLSPTQVTWSITRETQPPSECTAEKPSSCK